jgi:hypothetical protein
MNTCHAILKGTGPPYKGEEGAAARPKRGEVKNDPAHRRCAGPTYLRATRRGPPVKPVVLTGRHRRHPVALAASSLFDSRPPLPFLPRKKHFSFFEAPRRGAEEFDRRQRRSNAAACSSRPAGASLRPRRRSAPARPSLGERLASSGPPPPSVDSPAGFDLRRDLRLFGFRMVLGSL